MLFCNSSFLKHKHNAICEVTSKLRTNSIFISLQKKVAIENVHAAGVIIAIIKN